MRSFDLYSEKALRESSLDRNVSKSFSKEASDLDKSGKLKELAVGLPLSKETLSASDKTGLSCASFIIGSPFLMIGLGGALAMCDEMDFKQRNKDLKALQEQSDRRLGLTAAAALAAGQIKGDKTFTAMDIRNTLPIIPVEVTEPDLAKKKKRKPADNQVTFSDSRDFWKRPFMVMTGNWMEANKLLKLKKLLADQIKRLSRRQDYHTVCKLAAELELLDKQLSKLGY
jgi:hypothetical protein